MLGYGLYSMAGVSLQARQLHLVAHVSIIALQFFCAGLYNGSWMVF
jgi:hypothetical protein